MALIGNSLHPSFAIDCTKPTLLLSKAPQQFHSSTSHFSSSRKLRTSYLLPPTSSSTSPAIFLPFLEEEEEHEEELEHLEKEEEKEPDCPEDPIYRFFKSRIPSTTQDPGQESKLTLKRNRRTSWHLAGDVTEEESQPDVNFALEEEDNNKKEHSNAELGSDFISVEDNGIVGEILKIARNLPENSTLGEKLSGYEGKIGEKECIEVIGLLGEEGLAVSCLYFYEWMSLQEPSLVTPKICSAIFTLLGKARRGDNLMILWRNLPKQVEFRDVRVYNSAMSGFMSCGRYSDGWEVYEAMETNNILSDHITCSIMITMMRKEGRTAKEAWDFFQKMNRKGVEWSIEAVGALVKSFCNEGLQKQALIIQTEMEKKGITSNTIIYNTLMDAYCKSNKLEEAEALFVEMTGKGISPSPATYNILMNAYSKRMEPEIVEKLLIEMQETGLQPNVKSYTSLISAYGRQKKMSDMAADAFLRMRRAGIEPTSHSYTALIHAYAVSGWHEKAYRSFENMQREGIKPSIETYTTLLDAFRRAGNTKTLMTIWKSMIVHKIEGTRVTFNILLDGFAKQGQYAEARDVISIFSRIGIQPTVITYNMLINAYARGGQHLKLPELLKEMAALNLKPDSITYSTMIFAYIRVRDFRRAFYYHKQMVKSKQVPDAESYKKIRSILDVKAAIKNKKDKDAILGIVNSKLGRVKPKKKGKKDEFWKNKKLHVASRNSPAQAGR